jgi:thymidylate synthase (FAD)
MKIIKSSFEILYPVEEKEWDRELKLIEFAGRTAYKSEEKISDVSALPFIRSIVKRNHLAVIEFGSMTVKFITDRGVTHEMVRHRLCSFLQESTRYCNYSQDKFKREIQIIQPSTWNDWPLKTQKEWLAEMKDAEDSYLRKIGDGLSPQQARSVLPNSLKTEICVKANFREWRHIFQIRAVEKAAHPDMRALMIPFYKICRSTCPEIFDLGNPE